MKGRFILSCAIAVCAFVANAQWNDPVKWDQLSAGVDSYAAASWDDNDTPSDALSADDFLCTELGWITQIDWCGFSYYGEQYLDGFRISFWTDVPSNPNDQSHPGSLIYDRTFSMGAGAGYVNSAYNGATGFYDYSICLDELDWFLQQGSTSNPMVYWVSIQGLMVDDGFFDAWYWCFKNRSLPTWNDDAAFTSNYFGMPPWSNWGVDPTGAVALYDGPLPAGWTSLDMGYRLYGHPVPEPSAFVAAGIGALALLRRRRK